MILFPAIDLKDGACVRLLRGDMAAVTVYNDDPAEQARRFAESGFTWLHLVDLNGAIDLLDEAKPQPLIDYVARAHAVTRGQTVLDFGCGEAPHKSLLERAGFRWVGLDYEAAIDPTALNRSQRLDAQVHKYDGGRFPFDAEVFDAVWSYQSLEHVNSAEEAFSEIARVLKPGGVLFGSTSFLEPYHARSTFCYTPYGFKLLCDRNHLAVRKVFPSIDGLSLVFRHLFMMLGAEQSEWADWTKMMRGGGAFFEALRARAQESQGHGDLAEAMTQICGRFFFVAQRAP